jgi:hypothetical protein
MPQGCLRAAQATSARRLLPHAGPAQVFETLMVGILSDMSFDFSAIAIATLRAMAL